MADLEVKRMLLNLEEARHQLVALKEEFSRMAAEITRDTSSTHRYEMLSSQRLTDYLRIHTEDIRKRIDLAEADYQKARERRREVAIEVESLQTLRDLQWDQYRAKLRDGQTKQMDELVMNRWHSARRREVEAND